MDVKQGFIAATLSTAMVLSMNGSASAQFSGGHFQPSNPSTFQSPSTTNTAGNPATVSKSNFTPRTQDQSPFAGPNTEKIKWMDGKDLSKAFQLAAQQNKPVMLHFWNEKCQPCLALEQFVFPNPQLAQAINSQFIPVKVNTLATPEIHRKYNVTRWPWDVFISPNGLELSRRQAPNNASQYTQYVNSVAQMQQSFTKLTARPGSGGSDTKSKNDLSNPNPNQASTVAGNQSPNGQQFVSNSSFSSQQTKGQMGTAGGTNPVNYQGQSNTINFQGSPGPAKVANKFFKNSQNRQSGTAQTQDQQYSIGLEGYCPVTMLKEIKKVLGSKEYGCVHRGKLYFFANQSYRDIFMKDPDQYAPVLAGYDVVIYRETGKLVEGKTEFGGFVGQKGNRVVFLFASKDNKDKFINDKQGRYVETARIATKNTKETWLR